MNRHPASFLPVAVLLFVLLLVFGGGGGFPWWLVFVFFFIHRGARMCTFPSHHMQSMDKRKRVTIGDVEKRKNDDIDEPEYIRTRDGKWLEIID